MARKLWILVPLGLAISAPATAQGVAGQWQCQMANQSNLATGTWTYNFVMALNPDGSFQAQGSYYALSAGFSVNFQAGGGWQQSSQGVLVQGNEQRQDGTAQQFMLVFTTVQGNAMSHRLQNAAGVLTLYCQR
jgi:hypothetical protein